MGAFRVVIIGGSVAGLTLANILQRYGVDYIVLEKYPKIAPQLGASIGILPYGFQILDQIGVIDRIEALDESVDSMKTFGPDGMQLSSLDTFGRVLKQLTGYKFSFLDRQELIQALYNTLEDKSKVVVSKGLLKIEELDDSVTVTTQDGTKYTGDILVGADGVHSRTRDEIWRIADSDDPAYGAKSMANSITCAYRCMFGIADRPDVISDGSGFKTYNKNRSYLYQAGRGGKMYFFAFMRNSQVTTHRSIPKYSVQDEKDSVAEFGDDILLPGLTFGDVYKRRRSAVLTPLQEYVLDRKQFNPLTGQGGNSAIEDAALLADLLKDMLEMGSQLTSNRIQSAYSHFERQRRPRAKSLMDMAHLIQRFDALENPFLEFLNLRVMSKARTETIAGNFVEFSSPGHMLKYLPRSSRGGLVALERDVVAQPGQRSTTATLLWAGLMLLIAGLIAITCQDYKSGNADPGASSRLYTLMITITVNGMWTIESYRTGVFGGPLCRLH
ncbi:hypothetical protein BBP40_001167 [Aspergillus hancockii]|nr:hypothetical protein BBP40_001167 [Aspergillus hancockii]